MLPELRLRDPRPGVRAEQRGDAHRRRSTRVRRALVDCASRASTCWTCAPTSAPGEPNLLLMRVDYRLRAQQRARQLVYPFYLLDASLRAPGDDMPLAANYPVIDDRRYDDLVAEVRTRIPRYTPEWTDLNDNDPGMALVQLFAWLGEHADLSARPGAGAQLPEVPRAARHRADAGPAGAARRSASRSAATLPRADGHRPAAHPGRGRGPGRRHARGVRNRARADRARRARSTRCSSTAASPSPTSAAANADAQTGLRAVRPDARSAAAALMLGFDSALDFPSVEHRPDVLAARPRGAPPLYVDCEAAVDAAAGDARWEYWNGSEWQPLDLLQDETAAFTRSGHVRAAGAGAQALDRPLAARRPRRGRGAALLDPRAAASRRRTRRAPQSCGGAHQHRSGAAGADGRRRSARAAPPASTTRSSSSPTRRCSTARCELVVDEGRGEEPWEERPDFFASGPRRQALRARTAAPARCASGAASSCACRSPTRTGRRNVIALSYRFGGGAAGNVGAGRLTNLRGGMAGIDAGAVTNLMPAYGGGDEETLDAARSRAAQTLKSHERAVTIEDFELHARAAGDVARAKATAAVSPAVRGRRRPRRRSASSSCRPRQRPTARRPGADADRRHAAQRLRLPRAASPRHRRALRAGAEVPRDRRQGDAGLPRQHRSGRGQAARVADAGALLPSARRRRRQLVDRGRQRLAVRRRHRLLRPAAASDAGGRAPRQRRRDHARPQASARVQRRGAGGPCAAEERRPPDHRAVRGDRDVGRRIA